MKRIRVWYVTYLTTIFVLIGDLWGVIGCAVCGYGGILSDIDDESRWRILTRDGALFSRLTIWALRGVSCRISTVLILWADQTIFYTSQRVIAWCTQLRLLVKIWALMASWTLVTEQFSSKRVVTVGTCNSLISEWTLTAVAWWTRKALITTSRGVFAIHALGD